jgi:serine/threonine-protein kinase
MPDTLERLRAALAGRYTIVREVGAGGMATVYLAEDTKHHRKVALKVMKPELAATMGSTRFLREIQTAAQLQHPHILPLHDSGEADGFLYFVMPFVEGESLRAKLARGGELPVGEAVRVLRDVVDALSHAHAQGVVHRDVKPDNVLLSGRHALVTDFGVAKAVSEATGRNTITTVGVALGTPTYMAPEQAAADPSIDARADLYAVGCLAYELLTGQPPFRGESAQRILAAHVTEAPTPVTARRSAVPAALNAVVMRCLEKKPADRWQTADELLAQIEQFLTPSGGITPTDTRPLSGVRPVRLPSRRTALVAGSVVLALVLAGLWALRGRGGEAQAKPRLVVLPPRNLGPPEQAYVADGIAEEINNRLVGLSGIEVIGRTSAERYRATDKSPRQIGEELGVEYLLALRVGSEGPVTGRRLRVSAELLRGKTEAQLWGKSFVAEAADDYFRVQGEIATEVANEMGVALGAGDRERLAVRPTSNAEAYDYYLRGSAAVNRGYGIADFRDAVERFTRAVELDPRFALAWAGLGMAHTELYWFQADRTARRLDLARAAVDRAASLAPDDPHVHLVRGIFRYHAYLDYDGALLEMREAARLDPGRAEVHEWIGYVQRRAGQVSEAIASLERAVELDPQSGRLMGGLAETYVGAARYRDAERLTDRAYALLPTDWGVHYTMISGAIGSGDLSKARQRVAQAVARLTVERILVDRSANLEEWYPLLSDEARRALDPFPALTTSMADTAAYYLVRAQIRTRQGHDARADFDSAAARYHGQAAVRPEEPWIQLYLAQAAAGQGRRDAALRAGDAAMANFARDLWEGPGARAAYAEILWQFGERDRAVAELERFVTGFPAARDLVRHNPRYAAMREDPRVRTLIGR